MSALFSNLDCICPPKADDEYPASYTHGCPRHIALALATPTSAAPEVESHTVTYFHAHVRVSNPVLKVGDDGVPSVWWTAEHIRCEHHHPTKEAAARCAKSLARKAAA